MNEYTEAIRERYRGGDRKGKGQILDEFIEATGYHRKAAIWLLRRGHGPSVMRRGRPKRYRPEVLGALKVDWEAGDHLCGKRLKPFLEELVDILRRHEKLEVTSEVANRLGQISPATIARLLKPYRRKGTRRPFTTTKPGSLLKRSIPIRTFADWDENLPGFLEVDLVAHCGASMAVFYYLFSNTFY